MYSFRLRVVFFCFVEMCTIITVLNVNLLNCSTHVFYSGEYNYVDIMLVLKLYFVPNCNPNVVLHTVSYLPGNRFVKPLLAGRVKF